MNFKSLGFIALAMVGSIHASTITLTGTLRDFNDPMHPDFGHACCGDDHHIVTGALGVDGKPVYANDPASWSTHGASNFNQWFNDVSGVNISHAYSITLDNTGHPDVYTYSDDTFFPLDGIPGPAGETEKYGHNYGFTYELATMFTYVTGQTFTFTGDDDVFVYINNALVIDLGGVHGSESKSVDLNTLGLTSGSNYSMNVFFAERHTVESHFRIETNIASITTEAVPEPGTLALFGLGFAGLAMAMRRRKN